MGYIYRLTHYRLKLVFVCAVSFALLFGAWIHTNPEPNHFIKSDNPGKQDLPQASLLSYHEVSENDKRIWIRQFFTGVEKVLALSDSKKFKRIWQGQFLPGADNEPGEFLYNQSLQKDGLSEFEQSKVGRIDQKLNPRQSIKVSSSNGLFLFVEPASCEPISPEMILYNRIFKTGSETLGRLFKFVAKVMSYEYAQRTTEDFYDEGKADPYPLIIERAARTNVSKIFYNAHFYFRDNLRIQRTHTYINQVREPVSRYISHYAYMHNSRHRPSGRVQKMIENGEWDETIEDCFEKEGQGCKKNLMTRFFCGAKQFCKNDPRRALDRAKENILRHYAVVGLLEHFNVTLKILQKRLPYFFPFVPKNPNFKVNQAEKESKKVVNEEMITKIKQANWADVELYEFVEKLFWRQVNACGIS